MPAAVALAIQAFTALMAAAPQVAAILEQAKNFFTGLFAAGLITKAQQDAVHAHLDSVWAMLQSGITLDHWKVEPDPQ